MLNEDEDISLNTYIATIAFLLIAGLLLSYVVYTWVTSRYYIDANVFYFDFGISKGHIHINSITTIKKSSYPSSTRRPSFHLKGYLIYYRVSNEEYVPRHQLYVSPLEEELFLKSMSEINPDIVIR